MTPDKLSAMSLRIAPLLYEEAIEVGAEKTGFVDVSNPSDFTVQVSTSVEGFTQINNRGDLEFFSEDRYRRGIEIDVDEFELGPREAARIVFRVKGNQLPEGGVYAALFFEVDSIGTTEQISAIGTTTRVGTLLILQNGDGDRLGGVSDLSLPFLQLGTGINGTIQYSNPDTERAVGYTPMLTSQVLPWGGEATVESGLVLPGITREFELAMPGNYIGILPITVVDSFSGEETTTWVLALTGIWRVILPFFILALASSLVIQRHFKNHQ